AFGQKYRARMEISDLRVRAEQWLEDVLETGSLMIHKQEASPEFLVVVREVIQEQIDTFDDESRGAFKVFFENLDSFIQSRPKRVADDRSSVESKESMPREKGSPDDPIRRINLTRAEAVTRALTELVLRPLPED